MKTIWGKIPEIIKLSVSLIMLIVAAVLAYSAQNNNIEKNSIAIIREVESRESLEQRFEGACREQKNIEKDINEIKLDIREIKTILTEQEKRK